jgi:hypothetical protein
MTEVLRPTRAGRAFAWPRKTIAAGLLIIAACGLETRPIAAADDYRKGLAKKVLVANVRITQPETLGIVPSNIALARTALMKLGVPEADIEIFGAELANTHDEALALRELVIRSHASAVIVPAEISRRAASVGSCIACWTVPERRSRYRRSAARTILGPTGGGAKRESWPFRTRSSNTSTIGSSIDRLGRGSPSIATAGQIG